MTRRGWMILMAASLLVLGSALGWYTFVFYPQQATVSPRTLQQPAPSPTPGYLSVESVPAFTQDQLFGGELTVARNQLDPDLLFTMVATGDVIPARGVDAQIRRHGPSFPFQGAGIADILRSADIAAVNLEAPLLSDCPVHNTGFTFCGQAQFATSMSDYGVDMVTMANNHIGNYGPAGIEETKQHLRAANLPFADSQLGLTQSHGLTIGWLAFNGVGGRFYPDDIKQHINAARPQVDLLVVAYHWGKEYQLVPQADPNIAPDDPIALGRMTIDAGADLVIGNHPHWVQGAEIYQGKLILYALGNFIFDQSWSTETMQGAIARLTWYGTRLVGVEFLPIMIEHQAQPRLADSEEANIILERMKSSSQQIQQQPL